MRKMKNFLKMVMYLGNMVSSVCQNAKFVNAPKMVLSFCSGIPLISEN